MLCARCKKRDADGGYRSCAVCREKHRQQEKGRRQKDPEHVRRLARENYQKNREQILRRHKEDAHYIKVRNAWKENNKELLRGYYRRSHQKRSTKANEYQREKRQKYRKRIWEIQSEAGCAHCGVGDPVVLLFHHIDPNTKLFDIGAYGQLKPWPEIEAEMAKCIVLCHNCHRRLHFKLEHREGVD